MDLSVPRRKKPRKRWKVHFRKFDGIKRSQPCVIEEVSCARVRGTTLRSATLIALAPQMADLLEVVESELEFYVLMLRCEHPGLSLPDCVRDVRAVCEQLRSSKA